MTDLISKSYKILENNLPISLDIQIASLTGHLNAAILYGQLAHHHKNMGDFSKFNEELEQELNMSSSMIDRMKKLLINKGLISIQYGHKKRTIYSIVKKLDYCPKSYKKYYVNFCLINKNTNAGFLLGHLIYLYNYFLKDGNKEFFKTHDDLMKELHLTDKELKGAKKMLINNGFISVRKGQSRMPFYTVHIDQIERAIDALPVASKRTLSSHQKGLHEKQHRIKKDCMIASKGPVSSHQKGPSNIYSNIYNNILSSVNASKETQLIEFEAVTEERKKLKIKKEEQPMSTPNEPINVEKEETMEENKEIYQMIGIWKATVTSDEQINLSARITQDLQEALQMRFQGSVEGWKAYCEKISKNEWLMGKNDTGWKAQLIWAIKLENIDKVLSGLIYGKKKPIDYKTDQKPIQLDKQELIDQVLASQESYDIKKLKVTLIDSMHNSAKHVGLSSYHTYLHRHNFEESEVNGKKRLTIRSSYGAFNSLLSYHHLMTKAFISFDEVIIHGGTNDRLGNNLYMERKSQTDREPFDLWNRLCIEKGIESLMTISQVALVNACHQPQFL
jgi:hypothetical protein